MRLCATFHLQHYIHQLSLPRAMRHINDEELLSLSWRWNDIMDMKMPLITIICLMHIVEATASRESLMTVDMRNTLAERKRRRAAIISLSCIYDGSFPVLTVVDTKRRGRRLVNHMTVDRRSTEDGGWRRPWAMGMNNIAYHIIRLL